MVAEGLVPGTDERLVSCACGQVQLAVRGAPILTAACYCDDCQAGAEKLEALPGARPFHDADGGTWMALYRKDRHRVVRGGERLERTKLKPKSGTNRVVARCCNSAMLVDFDAGPHWISIYRPGYAGDLPPLEMRLQTRFAPDPAKIPSNVPVYRTYPLSFIGRLIGARIAMLFGR